MAYFAHQDAHQAVQKIRVFFHPVHPHVLQDRFEHIVETKVIEGEGAAVPKLIAHWAGDQVVYHVIVPQQGVGVLGYRARVHYKDGHDDRRTTDVFPLFLQNKKFEAMFTLPKASPKYHAILVLEPNFGPQH